jgi:hypothetical protein
MKWMCSARLSYFVLVLVHLNYLSYYSVLDGEERNEQEKKIKLYAK